VRGKFRASAPPLLSCASVARNLPLCDQEDDVATEPQTAAAWLPERMSMAALREAAAGCRGCPLWRNATQTVFGEGRRHAPLMLVGEMPGSDEDLAGKPFVGPAGRLLDDALAEAGIDRAAAYVTNVVKHFKWEPRGKRRLHRTPNPGEIRACVPWLQAEIDLIEPRVLVCLGATAARTLLGPRFRVSRERGRLVPSTLAPRVLATIHPSAILRADDEDRARELQAFVEDLRNVRRALAG
jgi:DNA polymerase